jgi:hypothetical protein
MAQAPFPIDPQPRLDSAPDDHTMDTYRQASSHMNRGLRTTILKASTPEERATYRRWARSVLACYCLLFVSGCIAVLANHSIANPDNKSAQALSQENVSAQAGR